MTKVEDSFFLKIIQDKPFKDSLTEYLEANKKASPLAPIWAGLIATHQEDFLLNQDILPTSESQVILQTLFRYSTDDSNQHIWAKVLAKFENILKVSQEGRDSIVADIEQYVGAYSKVFVDFDQYPFFVELYSRYAQDPTKIFYMLAVNQLKFYQSFEKSPFELKLLPTKITPLLAEIIDTPYWRRFKKIKFYHLKDSNTWTDFLQEYEEIFYADPSALIEEQKTIIATAQQRIAVLTSYSKPALTLISSEELQSCKLFTASEFLEDELDCDDGDGYWATSTHKSDMLTNKTRPVWATHVLWFNK